MIKQIPLKYIHAYLLHLSSKIFWSTCLARDIEKVTHLNIYSWNKKKTLRCLLRNNAIREYEWFLFTVYQTFVGYLINKCILDCKNMRVNSALTIFFSRFMFCYLTQRWGMEMDSCFPQEYFHVSGYKELDWNSVSALGVLIRSRYPLQYPQIDTHMKPYLFSENLLVHLIS